MKQKYLVIGLLVFLCVIIPGAWYSHKAYKQWKQQKSLQELEELGLRWSDVFEDDKECINPSVAANDDDNGDRPAPPRPRPSPTPATQKMDDKTAIMGKVKFALTKTLQHNKELRRLHSLEPREIPTRAKKLLNGTAKGVVHVADIKSLNKLLEKIIGENKKLEKWISEGATNIPTDTRSVKRDKVKINNILDEVDDFVTQSESALDAGVEMDNALYNGTFGSGPTTEDLLPQVKRTSIYVEFSDVDKLEGVNVMRHPETAPSHSSRSKQTTSVAEQLKASKQSASWAESSDGQHGAGGSGSAEAKYRQAAMGTNPMKSKRRGAQRGVSGRELMIIPAKNEALL